MYIVMKRILLLLLASLFMPLFTPYADDANAGGSVIHFECMPPSLVLDVYKDMSGLEFVVDSRVKTVRSPISLHIEGSPPPSTEEVLKQMREVFIKQAGIVITRLDSKRESVTFNDALLINK
jgi:hypothetical protein